jgi:hypothetical protein
VSYIAGALGVCVAAIYYVMNLNKLNESQRITVETRYAQVFYQITGYILSSEGLKHIQVVQENPFSNLEEFRELMKKQEFADAYLFWRQLYEVLGTYAREGAVDIKYVADMNPWFHIWLWERFRDVIYDYRRTSGLETYYHQWEFLYNRLKEYLAEHPELYAHSE